MKLLAWVFLPTPEDLKKPWDFNMPKLGEVRFQNEYDEPMDNERTNAPGWKRASWLDGEI